MIALHSYLSSYTLSEIFAYASRSGRISHADHAKLIAAQMDNSISEEEKNYIKRLLYGVRRNRIEVVGSSYFYISVANMAS